MSWAFGVTAMSARLLGTRFKGWLNDGQSFGNDVAVCSVSKNTLRRGPGRVSLRRRWVDLLRALDGHIQIIEVAVLEHFSISPVGAGIWRKQSCAHYAGTEKATSG